MRGTIIKVNIQFPPDTSLLQRIRIGWSVIRFCWRYNRATPQAQERTRARLLAARGVKITERKIP